MQQFLQTLITLPETSHYFYLKSHQTFYQMIHKYFLTKEIDMKKMNQALNVFKQVGYDTHEERLRSLLNKTITPG